GGPDSTVAAVAQARQVGEGELAEVQAEDVVVAEGEGGGGFRQAVPRTRCSLGDVLPAAADAAGVAWVVAQDPAACSVGGAFPRSLRAEARRRDVPDEVE